MRYVFVFKLVKTASIGFKGPVAAIIGGGGRLISTVLCQNSAPFIHGYFHIHHVEKGGKCEHYTDKGVPHGTDNERYKE